MTNDLFTRSIEIIKANQTQSGAYLASPNFAVYHYCWFRDGAYIAYAMDLAGEHGSSMRFYDWAATAIAERADRVERAVASAARGELPAPDDILHTRYTAEGVAADSDWPNFQLDGFGTLLWGISRHLSLTGRSLGDVPGTWREAVLLLVRYLGALWSMPCYDCWEEFGDKVHTSTLAALYGGLQAAAQMLGTAHEEPAHNPKSGYPLGSRSPKLDALAASEAASLIRRFVLDKCVSGGSLCKFIGSDAVDASLLHVATPYGLLSPQDPVMKRTVERIEADLRREGGGVHRYMEDSYYGGGEWVLLTAYLGWYYIDSGQAARAQALLTWVEGQAEAGGALPEQVACHLNQPEMLPVWEKRWGPIASPLLWSHASYLTLMLHSRKG